MWITYDHRRPGLKAVTAGPIHVCYDHRVAAPSDRAPSDPSGDGGRQPEWTHEGCVEYEVAREAITALMAFRSQWISDEQQKPAPDQAIERWEAESAQYALEPQGLDVRDQTRLAQICRDYGAEIRRLDAAEV
jgi:hypothetical protein